MLDRTESMKSAVRGLFGRIAAIVLATLCLTGCADTEHEQLYGLWTSDDGSVHFTLERAATFDLTGAQDVYPVEVPGDPGHLAGRYVVDTEFDLSDFDAHGEFGLRLNVLRVGDISFERVSNEAEASGLDAPSVLRVSGAIDADGIVTLVSDELFGGTVTLQPASRIDDIIGTSVSVFIGLTVILLGGAAFLSGQAVANGWGAPTIGVFYCIMLAFTDRFLTYALFDGDGTLITAFVISWCYFLAVFLFAHRVTMARKMVRQYPWMYRRQGLFGWRQIL